MPDPDPNRTDDENARIARMIDAGVPVDRIKPLADGTYAYVAPCRAESASALEPGTLPYEYESTDAHLAQIGALPTLRHAVESRFPERYAAALGDPTIRYRTTFLIGDGAQPPYVSGEVASQLLTAHNPIESDTLAEGLALMPDHIGRVLVEERQYDDVHHADRGDRWRAVRTWTRTDDGWGHS